MLGTTLFVNDNYFSYLLARPFMERHHEDISCVVLSNRITGDAARLVEVYRKSYPRYFLYRSLVEIVSRCFPYYRKRTIASLARQYGVPIVVTSDVNALHRSRRKLLQADVGVAFNFDQIIEGEVLEAFPGGVVNVHASRLPCDRGIAPVLWAFARGDEEIWCTIYRMDSGIDTGPILKQFSVAVRQSDSAFSLYQRVCERSGDELAGVLEDLDRDAILPIEQELVSEASVWSWPDATHREMMRRSGRAFLNVGEVLRLRVM